MPSISTAKLIGIGLFLLMVITGTTYAAHVVGTWRQAFDAQPQLAAARDQAVKERDDTNRGRIADQKEFVGAFNSLGGKIEDLQRRYADAQAKAQQDRSVIDAAIANFKKATENVQSPPLPGSADDVFVRLRLLDLLRNPDTGQLGREPGAGEGGIGAGASGPARQSDPVPGRRPAASDQQGAMVPGAGSRHRSGAKRAAVGRRRRGDRLGTVRTATALPTERMGPAGPECFVSYARQQGNTIAREIAVKELRGKGADVIIIDEPAFTHG